MYCKNCGAELNENQAVCLKCGVTVGKGEKYCANCGNEVLLESEFCTSCGATLKKRSALNTKNIKPTNLVTAIILSVVTCGFYAIYWFIKLTNEMNQIVENEKDTSGGIAFLLDLVTCGIYGLYWGYKMGEKRDSMDDKSSSSAILYLILMLVCPIVVYALLQDAINKAVENK